MNDQQAWESLGRLEAKYNALLAQANANIALLEQLCAEKDATLEASDSLLETYRQHDELQKAEIARLREALVKVSNISESRHQPEGRLLYEISSEARGVLGLPSPLELYDMKGKTPTE